MQQKSKWGTVPRSLSFVEDTLPGEISRRKLKVSKLLLFSTRSCSRFRAFVNFRRAFWEKEEIVKLSVREQ